MCLSLEPSSKSRSLEVLLSQSAIFGDDGSADMADFQVVNVPYNGELFSLYNLVCNTGIIRIDFETNRYQSLDKALVSEAEQCS